MPTIDFGQGPTQADTTALASGRASGTGFALPPAAPSATPPAPITTNPPQYSRLPADPTTTPTPNNGLPPGVDQSAVDAANKAKYDVVDPAKAAGDYTSTALKAAQDRIDGIGSFYDKQLKDELAVQAPVNENSLGRTNALSALMGLSGSSSADTRTSNTETDNAKINASIGDKVNAQRMAALDKIYGNIDAASQKVLEARIQTNKDHQKSLLDDIATNALGNVKAIATTLAPLGKTFDDWKNADGGDALNKVMQQTGKSEYQLRSEWNSSLPQELQPTTHNIYKDDGKGGTIMTTINFNPVTKKVSTVDTPLAAPVSAFNGEEKPVSVGGMLLVKQADGSWKNVAPDGPVTLSPGQSRYGADGKLIATAPTADKFSPAKDAAGNPLSFNTTTGEYTNANGQKVTPATTPDQTGLLDAPSVTAFLKDKNPDQTNAFNGLSSVDKSNVMQLINGDALLSDIMASRGIQGSAAKQQLLMQARAVDPNFSENANKQRYAFKNEWNNTNGKAYNNRVAINTGLGHLAVLKGLVDKLSGNGDFQRANSLGQWLSANVNGPNADTVATFNQTAEQLAHELATVYAGGNSPDEKSIQAQRDIINSAKPQSILNALVNNDASLLSSKLSSTAGEYKDVMGGYPDSPIIHPDVLNDLIKSGVDTSKIEGALKDQGYQTPSVVEKMELQGKSPGDMVNALLQDGSPYKDKVLQAQKAGYSPQEIVDYIKKVDSTATAPTSATDSGALKAKITQNESGGDYSAVGLETPTGKALGKYQIMPSNLAMVGLDGNDEGDRQKFLGSPAMQDKLFGMIFDHLHNTYGGNPVKIAAAYYGGPNAARIVGTPAADKKQTAGGKVMPSINEYVRNIVGRTA